MARSSQGLFTGCSSCWLLLLLLTRLQCRSSVAPGSTETAECVCEAGLYAPASKAACELCPARKTSPVGSSGVSSCVCVDGFVLLFIINLRCDNISYQLPLSVSGLVSQINSFRLEIAIASPSFASLLEFDNYLNV